MLRALFLRLSESRRLRALAERSSLGRRVSRRFVAGETVDQALAATRAVNQRGMSVSIDNLGENVTNSDDARQSAALYHHMLDRMAAENLDANVSLKLTHMGLDVDAALASELARGLVEHAVRANSFVRVDMEGSPYTQRTLDFVRALHREPGHSGRVGAVLQSYLYRSEEDARALAAEGIRIRLCKGAYQEPAAIAFQKKSEVDAGFVRIMKILLQSGVYHGIATHDEKMIAATLDFARAQNIPASAFEFQMLYGIRRDLQQKLTGDGWRVRVYIPFGAEWYPYFMRRLAERPANVFFLVKNLFR